MIPTNRPIIYVNTQQYVNQQTMDPAAQTAYPNIVPNIQNIWTDKPIFFVQQTQTDELLAKAYEIASPFLKGAGQGTLGQPKSHYLKNIGRIPTQVVQQATVLPAINIDASDKSINILSNKTENHIVNHSNPKEKDVDHQKKGMSSGERTLFALVGFTATVVCAYFFGKKFAQNEENNDNNKSFENLKSNWSANKLLYLYPYTQALDEIILHADSITKRNHKDRVYIIAFLSLGLIAGASAVAGGVIASNTLITASLLLGATTTIAAIMKYAYTSFSKRSQKDAEEIVKNLNTLPIFVYT